MLNIDVNCKDNICALATAPTQSAIALIRVSGPDALAIKEKIFAPKRGQQKPFVATLGDVLDIDEAICVYFLPGKSYTGEASFELSLHGSSVVVKRVLEALYQAGCRPAAPGEFSMRAVLSGKMDLCAAEAVCDLISARSTEAAQIALKNLKGGLNAHLASTRATLINALCETEARLDFPDEGLGDKPVDHLLADLGQAVQTLQRLIDGASLGTKLSQGARIVLFGKPNAGKSTLLNALVGEEKAIVHHLPGTTRDAIEATWMVKGIAVALIDVAGVREIDDIDAVEAIGIERAHQELARADAVLWLVDATNAHRDDEHFDVLFSDLQTPLLKVYTKSDLLKGSIDVEPNATLISAQTQSGLGDLAQRVFDLLVSDVPAPQDVLLTRTRQKDEVVLAHASMQSAHEALRQGQPDEVVASELRAAGQALDRLLGKSLNEEVLDLIFSRFCIGK